MIFNDGKRSILPFKVCGAKKIIYKDTNGGCLDRLVQFVLTTKLTIDYSDLFDTECGKVYVKEIRNELGIDIINIDTTQISYNEEEKNIIIDFFFPQKGFIRLGV